MTTFTGISHVDLTVSDVEASAEWYAKVLGLKRLARQDLDGRVMVVLAHPETRLVIGLNQHEGRTADRFDERNPGLDHIGFSVEQRDDLVALDKHLTALRVDHSPVTDAPSGSGTALVFRDPDNIQLEYWWTAPR
ncbi:MAG TPA: VOC family protein [Acidimicrobiales bacterium]|nr:VOC family protein [Acidimicrobiales bacterium]